MVSKFSKNGLLTNALSTPINRKLHVHLLFILVPLTGGGSCLYEETNGLINGELVR